MIHFKSKPSLEILSVLMSIVYFSFRKLYKFSPLNQNIHAHPSHVVLYINKPRIPLIKSGHLTDLIFFRDLIRHQVPKQHCNLLRHTL